MRDILTRFYKIARAESAYRLRKIGDMLFGEFEKSAGNFNGFGTGSNYDKSRYERFRSEHERSGSQKTHGNYKGDANSGRPGGGVPSQVVEDLAVFGLRPPSSWEDVRKARNREIKKYHSDRFIHDPEKYKTSKEIMQIYNAAYDRLKDYYNTRGGEL